MVQKLHTAPLSVRQVCLSRVFSISLLSANIIPQLAIYQSLIWSSQNGWMRCRAHLLKAFLRGTGGACLVASDAYFPPRQPSFVCRCELISIQISFAIKGACWLMLKSAKRGPYNDIHSLSWTSTTVCVCVTVLLLSCPPAWLLLIHSLWVTC